MNQNRVEMENPYDTEHPLVSLIQQLEVGRCFAKLGKQFITNEVMISKGITPRYNTAVFNDSIIFGGGNRH